MSLKYNFVDAADFGFLPENHLDEKMPMLYRRLQISEEQYCSPDIYDLADTVLLSNDYGADIC